MKVHLIDGTYELFRAYFARPPAHGPDGTEVGATRGLAATLISLVRQPDVTHVAVAFDHGIECFRNDLFSGYKTGGGLPSELTGQFLLAEDVARALGIVVWPMVEYEADDALATGVARFSELRDVEQVVICTPDKDLAQCVRGRRVVMLDRRRRITMDADAVRARFGVSPAYIPDYLALVGDTADGIPGLRGWGERSAATVVSRYGRIEAIPLAGVWDVPVRGSAALMAVLRERLEEALLYRRLATLVSDVPLSESLDDLLWRGAPCAAMEAMCARLSAPELMERVPCWMDKPLLP